jgi:hypothetical protein
MFYLVRTCRLFVLVKNANVDCNAEQTDDGNEGVVVGRIPNGKGKKRACTVVPCLVHLKIRGREQKKQAGDGKENSTHEYLK